MKQVDARREILAEWRALPRDKRRTEEDAARFAMTVAHKYKFQSDTADPYQTIRAWLLRDMSLRRGLPD
jgi:regulator of sirC expression with transglutaminase-like and TPR domain